MSAAAIVTTVVAFVAACATVALLSRRLPRPDPFDPNRDFILEMGCILAGGAAAACVHVAAYLLGVRP